MLHDPRTPWARDPRASETRSADEDVQWAQEWHEHGRRGLRIGRQGGRLVADWEGLGSLRARPDGSNVEVVAAPGLRPVDEDRWRQGAVRAFLRHLEGRPTLHASAVAFAGNAFVFLGDSGAGKSTCAASLCGELGGELLADDLVDLEGSGASYLAGSHDGAHWLRRDSAVALGHLSLDGPKGPVEATRTASGPRRLGALFLLLFAEESSPCSARPLRGEAAFAAINRAFVRFAVDDSHAHARDLDTMASIVRATPVFALTRPRSFARLEETARFVRDLAARTSAATVASAVP